MEDTRANDFIRKQKHTSRKRTEKSRRDAWAAMSSILKNSDIIINTKVRVWTLEENTVICKSPCHSALLTAIYMGQV